jgi:Gpi18-like mannosyltransferase
MQKKAVLLLIIMCSLFAGCKAAVIDESANLVKNGSFEEGGVTVPVGWRKDVYDIMNRTVNFSVETGAAHSGKNYAAIENISASDARIVQDISVRPDTLYRFSCWIKVDNVPQGHHGGNISVLGVFASSEPVVDTGGRWKRVEFYGRTGSQQRNIIVACRLGNYGEESIGRISFDDVAVHAVKGTPMAVPVYDLYKVRAEQQEPEVPLSVQDARKKTNALFWIIFFSIIFILIFFLIYYFFLREDRLQIESKTTKLIVFFVVLMVIALLLRIFMGYYIEGQEGDLACFKGWGTHAVEKSWPDYYDYFSAYHNNLRLFDIDTEYESNLNNRVITDRLREVFDDNGYSLSDDVTVVITRTGAEWSVKDNGDNTRYIIVKNGNKLIVNGRANYWCDYPPVYVMVLALLAFLQRVFHVGHQGFTLLVKMPNIIADIIICYLIYILAKRRLNNTIAVALAVLYAFNPAIIINSAVWGQADAIYTLLALLIAVFIIDNKYWLASIILGIALLIKIQTAFVMFAGIYALIEKKSIKTGLITVGAGLGAFILFILPFGIKLPFEWIIVQLYGTLTGYPYASVNAYNFYAMIGSNWIKSNQPMPFFNISADLFGTIVGYLFLVFTIFIYFWSKEKSKNYYVSCLIMSVIFMFIPGMHERYLYATVLFSLMTYVYSKDRRFLFLFVALSISLFVNVYHILDVFIVHYLSHIDPYYPMEVCKYPVMLITSIANLLIIMYMVKVGVDVYIRKQIAVDRKASYLTSLEIVQDDEMQEKRKKPPVMSPKRIPVLVSGLASAFLPPLGLYPWIVGRTETVQYPEDNLVKAGLLLGKSIIIFWIVTLILGGGILLGMKIIGAM